MPSLYKALAPVSASEQSAEVVGLSTFNETAMKMDRIEINRRILQLNGKIYLYPWTFKSHGMVAVSKSFGLRSFGFIIQFISSALYAVYIDLVLIRTVLGGFKTVSYDIFGLHLMRGLLSTTFSYWAYELFIAHATEHEILYNFVQPNPGIHFVSLGI